MEGLHVSVVEQSRSVSRRRAWSRRRHGDQYPRSTNDSMQSPLSVFEGTALLRRLLRHIRAWMLVLPVDLGLLLLPILWTPDQWKASIAMAALSLILFTGGGRYR